jgi:hypothetical protein
MKRTIILATLLIASTALARPPARKAKPARLDPAVARAVNDMPLPSLSHRFAAQTAVFELVDRLARGVGLDREAVGGTVVASRR